MEEGAKLKKMEYRWHTEWQKQSLDCSIFLDQMRDVLPIESQINTLYHAGENEILREIQIKIEFSRTAIFTKYFPVACKSHV